MIYSESADEYFDDPGQLDECAAENGCRAEDLRPVICEPVYARQLTVDDYVDYLPDEFDALPIALQQAIDAYNSAVADVVLSWTPGKYALQVAP